MRADRFFSPEELREIERRVAEAEATTAGEIVPYAVDASDPYPEAAWAAAALGALLGPALALAAHAGLGLWGGDLVVWVALPPVVGAAVGWLCGRFVPPLRRALVPAAVLDRRCELRAAAAFVDEEVFATRERTGVLLFVSLFEHRVLVLADSGIHARVDEAEWKAITRDVAAGIRAGEAGRALARAVTRCGELLAGQGVERPADDTDELADRVRREEL